MHPLTSVLFEPTSCSSPRSSWYRRRTHTPDVVVLDLLGADVELVGVDEVCKPRQPPSIARAWTLPYPPCSIFNFVHVICCLAEHSDEVRLSLTADGPPVRIGQKLK